MAEKIAPENKGEARTKALIEAALVCENLTKNDKNGNVYSSRYTPRGIAYKVTFPPRKPEPPPGASESG